MRKKQGNIEDRIPVFTFLFIMYYILDGKVDDLAVHSDLSFRYANRS
jgi:hypothetical protein